MCVSHFMMVMIYRLVVHHLRDDHFLVLPIFPFRHADFVEVKY
jgi:hypothetical protein